MDNGRTLRLYALLVGLLAWDVSGSITGLSIRDIQHTQPDAGWDYYQIVTTQATDVVPEPATVGLLPAGAVILRKRRTHRR